VADSAAYAVGIVAERPAAGLDAVSGELYWIGSSDRPDRSLPEETREGTAVFARAAIEQHGWRGHLIVWRGSDFNHEDGDVNYLARFADGTRYPGTRDYGELGVTRLFKPASSVDFEASARLHRIEAYYSYSYRVLAIIHLNMGHFGS
jgi:hypothetical protein